MIRLLRAIFWIFNNDSEVNDNESQSNHGHEDLNLYELFFGERNLWSSEELEIMWKPVTFTFVSHLWFLCKTPFV